MRSVSRSRCELSYRASQIPRTRPLLGHPRDCPNTLGARGPQCQQADPWQYHWRDNDWVSARTKNEPIVPSSPSRRQTAHDLEPI